MKIVAITTFPPSTYAHSSFGLHAIRRFEQQSAIKEIVVLADEVALPPNHTNSSKVKVKRCWRYNSPTTIFNLIREIRVAKPDLVWMSLHYSLFARHPVFIALSLMLPILLKLMGFSVVILLHNCLAVVETEDMGLKLPKRVIRLADAVVMRSIMSADIIFTMVKSHAEYLSNFYDQNKVILVEQDLYSLSDYHPISLHQQIIFTLGYFGTHKRLEILIDAFELVRKVFPNVKLKIAGCNNLLNPNYLENLKIAFAKKLEGIEFLGYVEDEALPQQFWNSNIVVATTVAHVGSSALLRYAATYGRGIVVPRHGYFAELNFSGWGIAYYEPGNVHSLARILIDTISSPQLQTTMAEANHHQSIKSTDSFMQSHLEVFMKLCASRMNNR